MTVEVCPFGSSAVIFYYCTIWENPAWTCWLSEWMICEKFKIKFFVRSSTCWLHLESLGRSRCLPGNPLKFMLFSAKSKKATQKLRNNSIVILLAKLFLVEAPITIGVKLLEDWFSPKDKRLHKALFIERTSFCVLIQCQAIISTRLLLLVQRAHTSIPPFHSDPLGSALQIVKSSYNFCHLLHVDCSFTKTDTLKSSKTYIFWKHPSLTRSILVIHTKRPAQLVLRGLTRAHIRRQNKLLPVSLGWSLDPFSLGSSLH